MKQLPTSIPAKVNENRSQVEQPANSGIMIRQSEHGVVERKQEAIRHHQLSLHTARRVPLDERGRQQTLTAIIEGLKGFSGEQAARVATATYDQDWFEAEPDLHLRSMLANKLLEMYDKSPSANLSLWKRYS